MTQRAIAYAVYCTEPDGTAELDLFTDSRMTERWVQWSLNDGCEVTVVPLSADSEINEALAFRSCLPAAVTAPA